MKTSENPTGGSGDMIGLHSHSHLWNRALIGPVMINHWFQTSTERSLIEQGSHLHGPSFRAFPSVGKVIFIPKNDLDSTSTSYSILTYFHAELISPITYGSMFLSRYQFILTY